MPRRVQPSFTEPQARMVRVAICWALEGELEPGDVRVLENAQTALTRALAGEPPPHKHRPVKGSRNRLTGSTVEYLCRDCNAYYIVTA